MICNTLSVSFVFRKAMQLVHACTLANTVITL